MKEIVVIIEKSLDGFYWAYSEESAVTGGGTTIEMCKKDVFDCIELLKTLRDNQFLDNTYKISFKQDFESL